MKYFLVAGEHSGDIHGSQLINALKEQDNNASFFGMGGSKMLGSGMEGILISSTSAIMGFFDVLANLFALINRLRTVKDLIADKDPDILILIDYAGFNLRLVKWASHQKIPVCYYIAPKLWAWNARRILKIKKYVNQMLVVFPFEVEYFRSLGYKVQYVGSPILEYVDATKIKTLEKGSSKQFPQIAVLPGSRIAEVSRTLDVLEEVVVANSNITFTIAALSSLPASLYDRFNSYANCRVFYDLAIELISRADVAIVTSGTATLETALIGTPQVVIYKTNILNFLIARIVVKVRYISLVNLLLNREVIDELVQRACTSENLNQKIQQLLYDNSLNKKISEGYSEIRNILGKKCASKNAAIEITQLINAKQL